MLRDSRGTDFVGKRVALSGSGNVAQVCSSPRPALSAPELTRSLARQYAALKIIELGGIVVSLSDSKGSLVATGETGLTPATIAEIGELKLKFGSLSDLGEVKGFAYVASSLLPLSCY